MSTWIPAVHAGMTQSKGFRFNVIAGPRSMYFQRQLTKDAKVLGDGSSLNFALGRLSFERQVACRILGCYGAAPTAFRRSWFGTCRQNRHWLFPQYPQV